MANLTAKMNPMRMLALLMKTPTVLLNVILLSALCLIASAQLMVPAFLEASNHNKYPK